MRRITVNQTPVKDHQIAQVQKLARSNLLIIIIIIKPPNTQKASNRLEKRRKPNQKL